MQEKAQEFVSVTPAYKVLHQSGPDHDKQFEVAVYLEELELGKGLGSSKKEAEQEAAKKALSFLEESIKKKK